MSNSKSSVLVLKLFSIQSISSRCIPLFVQTFSKTELLGQNSPVSGSHWPLLHLTQVVTTDKLECTCSVRKNPAPRATHPGEKHLSETFFDIMYNMRRFILSRGAIINFSLEIPQKRPKNNNFLNIYLIRNWEYEPWYKIKWLRWFWQNFCVSTNFATFLWKNYHSKCSHKGT